MKLNTVIQVSAVCLLFCWAAGAKGNVPDVDNSYAECATSDPVMLRVLPDGSGDRLAACVELGMNTRDATITLTLLDANYDPVAFYPASDIMLVSPTPNWGFAPGGNTPDSDTDLNGQARWSGSLAAGGTNESVFIVVINSSVVPVHNANIYSTSPDLNASGHVNLTDVILFAQLYYGRPYHPSADFYFDGQLNLSDVVWLAVNFNPADLVTFCFYYPWP